MWRYLAGGGAVLAMVGAGALVLGNRTPHAAVLPAQPVAQAGASDPPPLPDTVPEASERTREQKRFDRYDKDRDGKVTREEYLAARRKTYAKLDTNHDGQLSFDEWAIKATTKFDKADGDKSGAMSATEFATTAVKRSPRAAVRCPPASAPKEDES